MRSAATVGLFIAGVLAAVALVAAGCGGSDSSGGSSDQAKAIAEAMTALQKAQSQGQNLSGGPCIEQHLPGLPDWAADIAHNPRQPVDDQPANQCQSYRDGQTHHFVELTPTGQLIRAQ
jgi:Flp pilus assembly protein TadD